MSRGSEHTMIGKSIGVVEKESGQSTSLEWTSFDKAWLTPTLFMVKDEQP